MAGLRLIPIQAKSPQSEGGYALTEVLIAAAILAGILAVTATSLSTSLRGTAAVEARTVLYQEAENIARNLEVGISSDELSTAYPAWQIIHRGMNNTPTGNRQSLVPVKVFVRHSSDLQVSFSTVILLTQAELERRQS